MSPQPVKVAPSLLAADFSQLGHEAKRLKEAGVDALHIDVMDGHFVKNLTMGPQIVSALRTHSDLFLDVHLMIYNPFDYIERFVAAGAHRITFHFEATEQIEDTIDYIKRCGIEAGLAFCPETSPTLMIKFFNQIDLLLIMTVHPGFGGQAFLPEVLDKIEFAKQMSRDVASGPQKRGIDIQVDGGINRQTANLCLKAGANSLVAGTWLFAQRDLKTAISELRGGQL